MVKADGSFLFDALMSITEKEIYAVTFFAGSTRILETTFDAAVLAVGEVPVVLSRNYFIETVSETTGERRLVRLMEKGTQLPCSRDYEFRCEQQKPVFCRVEVL